MRRTDKEITDRELIDRIIAGCQVVRLGLAQDNVPYIVPLSFGYDGSALYFHTALTGRKIACMEANPGVCFELEQGVALKSHSSTPCNWTFSYQCVMGYGTVSELVGIEDKTEGLLQVMRQYGPEEWSFTRESMDRIRVWKVVIDSITGKQSKDKFLS